MLPMSDRLERAFAAELPDLPAATRDLLVMVAAGADDLASLSAVSGPIDVLAGLEPAERCGLLTVAGQRIEWRHPLARAATYAAATADERSRAHRALAALPTQAPDRRAWHLARAAVGPDEAVAAELEAAAVRARQRGGYVEASHAMQRSAELSPDPAARARRLAETAAAGDLRRPVQPAPGARPTGPRADRRPGSCCSRSTTASPTRWATRPASAAPDSRWWTSSSGPGSHEVVLSWSSLTSLAALALRTGEGTEAVAEWQRRLESVDQPVPWPFSEVIEAARAFVRAVGGGPSGRTLGAGRAGAAPARTRRRRPADLVFNVEMLLGTVAWLVDEHEVAQRRLSRAAELMLRADAPGELAQTLLALGQVRFEMGRWDEAEETARLLSDFAEARGLEFLSHAAAELKARVAAVRGDAARASEIVQAIEAAVDPGEWASLTCDLIRTRGLVALSAGDHALAYAHLQVALPRRRHPAALAHVRARPRRPRARRGPDRARRRGGPADRLGGGPRRRAPQRARRDGRGPGQGERLRRGRPGRVRGGRRGRGRRDLAVRAGHREARVRRVAAPAAPARPMRGSSCRRR